MSGAGESPRVPPEAQSQDIAGMTSDLQPLGTRAQAQAWWDTLLESEKTRRLADAQVDGFGLTCTTANLAPRTLVLLYGRSLTTARFQPIKASTVNPAPIPEQKTAGGMAALNWWAMVGPNEREDRLRDLHVDGFALTCTARNVSPRTLAIMYVRWAEGQKVARKTTAANAEAARLGASATLARAGFRPIDRGIGVHIGGGARIGGDGEPYPEDVAIPVPIRGGLSGPRQSTPEERAKAAWPDLAEQTKCWPPKPKADEERQVMADARATLDLAALAGDEVDWTPLAYRLARIPKAREAIFAAMDVEGRPWRWADTVVIAIFALVFMAAGAALLAVAAKLAA